MLIPEYKADNESAKLIHVSFLSIDDKEKFEIVPTSQHHLLPYDYVTSMHYESNIFSKNGDPTIVPVSAQVPPSILGTSSLPTTLDFTHINLLYCDGNDIDKVISS